LLERVGQVSTVLLPVFFRIAGLRVDLSTVDGDTPGGPGLILVVRPA
jgi:Kef-type K+ transport system membrane component KefB